MQVARISPQQITDAYAEMAARYVEDGWAPYLMTFMFRQLPGSPGGVARQMERELERVFSRFVTRCVRNPRSKFATGRLPVWLCSPDYPVFKYAKQSLSDVAVNDGRHMHAIGLQPPKSRLKVGLGDHFDDCQHLYIGPDFPLARMDVQPITHDIENVVGYVQKAVRTGRVGDDGTFVLPATVNGQIHSFLFDTGASSVVLTIETARQLGIRVEDLQFRVPVQTANGRTMAAPTLVASLTIGPITLSRIPALVAGPGLLHQNLLGQTALDQLESYEVRGNRLVLRAGKG